MPGDFSTLTFGGTNLVDGTIYLTVIPDLDTIVENSIAVVRAHHTKPSFGLPTPLERVLTANCFIYPTGTLNWLGFDSRLDTLKQLLNTIDGTKVLAVQRPGWSASRYLNCHVRQMAVNRIERKITWQFVASDPFWRSVSGNTNTQAAIVANGTTWSVTAAGTKSSLPKFTTRINTANANAWLYHRRIILRNTMYQQVLPAGYTIDITNGGLDTATLVSGGKMKSDGSDVRVEMDGKEIPIAISQMNTANSKIWIRLPETLPALNPDNTGGEFVTLGTDVAPGTQASPNTVTSTGTAAGNNVAANVIGVKAYFDDGTSDRPSLPNVWLLTGTAGSVTINLGSSQAINRVHLLHLPSPYHAKSFTIQTSPDNSAWTTQKTVTNNTVNGKYDIYDFGSDVTCQYVKIDITAGQAGATATGLNKVRIYHAIYRLVMKYGLSTAEAPSWEILDGMLLPGTSTAWQPMFDINASTNQRHVYTAFIDNTPEGQYRTHQWQAVNQFGDPLSRVYQGVKDTLANPSLSMGIAQVNAGTEGMDAWKLMEPCGILGVNHAGYFKQNSTYYQWRQLSQSKAEMAPAQDWIANINSPNAWSYYSWKWNSYTAPDEQSTKYYILFNLKRVAADPNLSIHYAEADNVTVQLVTGNVPSITLTAEDAADISWHFAIQNTTNSQRVELTVAKIAAGVDVVIDCDLKKVYRSDDNQNLLAAFTVDGPRTDWMTLDPGANTLKWLEQGIASVRCVTTWEDRWL